MFDFQDLFQWDRFITPTIIKTFYWLVIALIVLFGISGIFSGLAMMAVSPFGGFIMLLSSIASVIVGVIFSRIGAEFVLSAVDRPRRSIGYALGASKRQHRAEGGSPLGSASGGFRVRRGPPPLAVRNSQKAPPFC